MKFINLGSGSSGNCFIVHLEGASLPLILEAGLSYKAILKGALENGIRLSEVGGYLISHSHTDHSLAVKELLDRGAKVYSSEATATKIGGYVLPMLKPTLIGGGYAVLPFEVNHDCEGACGYVVKSAKETLIFAIDNKGLLADLRAFKPDFVIIECDYFEKKAENVKRACLERGGKEAIDLASTITRATKYHSGLKDTLINLKSLDLSNLKATFLVHLSDRFADGQAMKKAVATFTKKPCFYALKKGGIE